LARRRLLGWKVRLLTDGSRSSCVAKLRHTQGSVVKSGGAGHHRTPT
jgi:hypothetical protein